MGGAGTYLYPNFKWVAAGSVLFIATQFPLIRKGQHSCRITLLER